MTWFYISPFNLITIWHFPLYAQSCACQCSLSWAFLRREYAEQIYRLTPGSAVSQAWYSVKPHFVPEDNKVLAREREGSSRKSSRGYSFVRCFVVTRQGRGGAAKACQPLAPTLPPAISPRPVTKQPFASSTLSPSISLSPSHSSRLPRYSTLRETLLDLSRNKQAYSALPFPPRRDLRPVIRVKTQDCRATFEDIAPLVIRRKIEPVGLKRVLNSKLNISDAL